MSDQKGLNLPGQASDKIEEEVVKPGVREIRRGGVLGPEYNIMVVKFSGHELDANAFVNGLIVALKTLLEDDYQPVVVHGGGKAVKQWQERLGLEASFVEGLRVTDDETLDVAEMVLSGLTNKRLVGAMVAAGLPALGMSGVDGGLVRVEKMWHPVGDLGWVGEVKDVNRAVLLPLIDNGVIPVVSPISLGLDGHTYNVNADHVARALAVNLEAVRLVFVSNVPGVLVAGQVARAITLEQAEEWIAQEIITGGMIPKVRSAMGAVEAGVAQAVITNLAGLQEGGGTAVVKADVTF